MLNFVHEQSETSDAKLTNVRKAEKASERACEGDKTLVR